MHLEEINKGYFEHLIGAWTISGQLVLAASVCFVHGMFPDFAKSYASTRIKKLSEKLHG